MSNGSWPASQASRVKRGHSRQALKMRDHSTRRASITHCFLGIHAPRIWAFIHHLQYHVILGNGGRPWNTRTIRTAQYLLTEVSRKITLRDTLPGSAPNPQAVRRHRLRRADPLPDRHSEGDESLDALPQSGKHALDLALRPAIEMVEARRSPVAMRTMQPFDTHAISLFALFHAGARRDSEPGAQTNVERPRQSYFFRSTTTSSSSPWKSKGAL